MNIIKYISYNHMIWVIWLYNYVIKCDYNYIIMIIIPFMLSTFSCTCCPFICLHWKNVFSIPLPIFNLRLFCFCFCYWVVWVLYIFWTNIFWTNLLSVMWFPNTYCHSIDCLLILWIVCVYVCEYVCVCARAHSVEAF